VKKFHFRQTISWVLPIVAWLTINVRAQEPAFEWALLLDHKEYAQGDLAVSADATGNLFLTDNVYYSQGSLHHMGSRITKLTRDGDWLWTQEFPGAWLPCCGPARTAVGPDGSYYVTGQAEPGAFQDYAAKLTGTGYVFVLKISQSGVPEWIHLDGGATNADVRSGAVAVDSAGNYYIGGQYSGSARFGEVALPVDGGGGFVAKYDSFGRLQWVHNIASMIAGPGFSIDSSGSVLVSGQVGSGGLQLGGIDIPALQSFVSKYDANGALLWAAQAASPLDGRITRADSLGVDRAGNTYVATDEYDFIGNGNVGIYKFGPAGELEWRKEIATVTSGRGLAPRVTVDAAGNCYIVGNYHDGSIQIGNTTLSTIGNFEMFLVKFNTQGDLRWVLSTTAAAGPSVCDTRDCAITLDPSGRCYVAACLKGPVWCSSTLLDGPTQGLFKVAVAKVNDPDQVVLQVRRTSDQLFLSWPANQTGFILERATDLSANNPWQTVTDPIVPVGDQNTVAVDTASGRKFYRLRNQ